MAAMRIPALLLLLSLAPTQSTPTTTLKSAPLALPLIPLDGSSAYNKTNVTVVLDRKFHTWCSASETLISGHDSFLESLSRALDVGEGLALPHLR
ncbi:hypothetical protein T484DRAFT_1801799 [Baffinella frigidus]|nr:hypothetical protein T484DRAFT_1801799 [Cryptophyta sp. CCMP2293]